MARQVATFVRQKKESGVSLFVIQCDAGVSRSAATASALSLYFSGDDTFFRDHFVPNPLVRALMLQALREGSE